MSSKQTDEQIIKMRFDNQQFERNARKSLDTITDLKKSMKFDDIGKDFDKITRASKNVDLSGLVDNVDRLNKRFTVLGATIYNEIQGAVNKSIGVIKNLYAEINTVPMKTGLSEYETQINSIQTIWANTKDKGTSMDQITSALDELNTYADKTIYNFAEMTRNIGTFTAAGVDLETSVKAIQGIANLGAMSGSNSEQVSRAMYQMSQAMAAGTVRLQDWNSMTYAGMGGLGFQKVLMDTARESGVAVDQIVGDIGNFRNSLQEGWLTADIFNKALAKYTDTTTELGRTATDAATKVKTFTQLLSTTKEMLQSGWTQSWTYIIGGFEEARDLFTSLKNSLEGFLQPAQDARNEMLKYWSENSVLDKELSKQAKEQKRISDELTAVAKDVISGKYGEGEKRRDLLSEMGFDPDKVEQRVKDVQSAIQNGTEYIDKSLESSMTGRDYLLKGLANIGQTLIDVLNAIRYAWKDAFPPMTGERLVSLSKAFYEFSQRIKSNERLIFNIRRTLGGLFSILSVGVTIVKAFAQGISAIFGAISKGNVGLFEMTGYIGDCILLFSHWLKESGVLTKVFVTFGKTIGTIISKAIALFKDLFNAVSIIFEHFHIDDIFKNILSGVSSLYDKVMSILGKFRTTSTGDVTIFSDNVTKALAPLDKAATFVKNAWTGVIAVFKAVKAYVTPILEDLKNRFVAFTGIKDLNSFLDVLQKGGITALIYKLVSFVSGLGKTTNGLSDIIGGLKDVLGSVSNVINSFALNIKIQSLKAIAASLIMLAGAVIALGVLPKNILNSGLKTLAIILGELTAALIIMGKISIKGIAGSLLSIAIAINALLVPISVLSLVPWEFTIKGMGMLAIMLGELALSLKLIGNAELKGTATTLLALGTAINMLIIPIVALGAMNGEIIGKGVFHLAMALLSLSLSVKMMTTVAGKELPKVTSQLLSLATAINLLVLPIIALGLIDSDQLQQGGRAVAQLLIVLAGCISLIGIATKKSDTKKIRSTTTGLALAISAIAGAVKLLSSVDEKGLIYGVGALVAILGAITVMSVGLRFLSKGTDNLLKVGKSIAGFGLGILALSTSFKMIKDLKPEEIAKGIIATMVPLAAIVTMVTVANRFLKDGSTDFNKLASGIAILSGSLLVISVAFLALQSADFGKMMGSVLALTTVLGVLTASMVTISKLGNGGKDSILLASSIAILTGSLLIIVGSLALLQNFDFGKMMGSILALTIVMGTLTAAVSVISKLGKGGKDTLKIAGSLTMLCGSLVIIATALLALGSMDYTTIGVTMLALTSVMMVFVALLKTMKNIGKAGDILKMAGALTMMAASTVVIATALLMLGGIDPGTLITAGVAITGISAALMALSKFVKIDLKSAGSFLMLAAGIVAIAGAIRMLGDIDEDVMMSAVLAITLLTGGMTALVAILGSLNVVALIGAGSLLMIGAAVLSVAGAIYLFVAALEKLATTDFSNLKQNVSDAIYGMVMGVEDALKRIITEILPEFVVNFFGFLGGIWQNIVGFGQKIIDTIKSIASDFIAGFVQGIQDGKDAVWDAVKGLGGGIVDKFCDVLGIHSPSTVMYDAAGNVCDGFTNGLADGAGGVWDGMSTLAGGCVNSFDGVIGNWDLAGNLTNKITSSMEEAFNAAANYAGMDINDIMWDRDLDEASARRWRKNMTIQSLREAAPDATDSEIVRYLTLKSQGKLSTFDTEKVENERLLERAQRVLSQRQTFLNNAASKGDQKMIERWKHSISEIQSKINEYNRKIKVYTQFGATAEYSSGSSGFDPEAAANKIRFGGYTPTSASDLGTSFENLTAENQNLGYSMDDLSTSLDDLGSSVTGGSSSGISGGSAFDDSNIVAELQNLRNDIEMLNRTVANMKIVLDSGELVGAMVNEMDASLARVAVYKGRGI